MAEADYCSGRRRFAVACSVLSRCVKAKAATAGRMAGAAHTRSAAQAAARATMPLMLGADVVVGEETSAAAATPSAPAQLTITYGGRVLVFDDVQARTVAEMVRVAARQGVPGGPPADPQVARKASSLQRLMEKRRDRHRLRARLPYAPARPVAAVARKKGQEGGDAGGWLGLGIPGGCAC
ncbi:uncharacterized protein C2845_PM01G43860 [Panicum miliaceum]|uniref:Protein TIFY n=1 Tax=Panicum miliaceum TaxID=4540 RepID=A0A3L6TS00_PANMI|nr:uncharacterized protein C2845_PM01G43860 [Panicum miliaceum]